MAYDNHDANVIKSALEHGIGEGMGDTYSEVLRRDALAALERLVTNYLPERATERQFRSMTRTTRTPDPERPFSCSTCLTHLRYLRIMDEPPDSKPGEFSLEEHVTAAHKRELLPEELTRRPEHSPYG